MKIYYFSIDENGIYYAGIKTNCGKRLVCDVTRDFLRDHFTSEQAVAFSQFKESGLRNLEFFNRPI